MEKWVIPLIPTKVTAKTTLDRAGRISIPKILRQALKLSAGDILRIETRGEQITLRPIRPKAMLKKERGLWVYQGEPTNQSIPDLIDRVREQRLHETMG